MDEDRIRREPAPEDEPRLHPLTRTGIFLGIFLALQILVGIPATLIWAVLARVPPAAFSDGTVPVAAVLFVYACVAPVLVPVTVAVLRALDRRPLASIGVRLPAGGLAGALRQAGWGAATAAGVLALWLAAVALPATVHAGGPSDRFWSGPAWLPGSPGAALVLTLYLVGFVVQAGLEEWVFRGYAYRALRERWSWPTVAGATSLGFGLLHAWNPGIGLAGLLNTFLLGFAFAAAVEGTGTLWPAIAGHGAWNFFLSTVLGLPMSGTNVRGAFDLSVTGPVWATGGDYGPEGSWLLTALLVPVVVALALWVDARQAPAAER